MVSFLTYSQVIINWQSIHVSSPDHIIKIIHKNKLQFKQLHVGPFFSKKLVQKKFIMSHKATNCHDSWTVFTLAGCKISQCLGQAFSKLQL